MDEKEMKHITRQELIKKYHLFFESKGHVWISGASLIPENDPTVLFTTAGMHPLVPYLVGQKHPEGKRLANVQKCIRTGDIDEVGDATHHTFFEMLGNWSLGDYFKPEAIEWSYEFLTAKEWLGLDKKKLAVSVFIGDENSSFDQESYDKWLKLGIPAERIAKLGKNDNWWGPAGNTGPCGPDTEMFYWVGDNDVPDKFDAEDKKWVEIWNDVFMQYNKTADGKFEPLAQKNVDTGMGLARALMVLNGLDDDYRTEIFAPIISKIETISGEKYQDHKKEFRIIADHITAAVFAISDGVVPSNKGAGFVVRRLIRRATVKAQQIGITGNYADKLARVIFEIYSDIDFKQNVILDELEKEETKFRRTLKEALKLIESCQGLSGHDLFDLYQTYGLPLEITLEEAKQAKISITDADVAEYHKLFKEHQDLSRTASAGMFKGGLADASEITTKYHTATHLLLAALKQVLGDHVNQRGSNITAERLRFDFSHPEKMTEEQIKKVEDIINQKIKEDIPVTLEEMSITDAKKSGATGIFDSKYGNKVKVYTIGSFSREICGGPHVNRAGEIGRVKITKEEASSSGIRRIKAIVE